MSESTSEGKSNNTFSLKNTLFGNWDRGIASTSLFIGLISLTITVILWRFPEDERLPYLIVARDISIVFLLLVVIIILLVNYFRQQGYFQTKITEVNQSKNELEDRVKKLENSRLLLLNQLKHSHDMVNNLKNEIFTRFQEIVPSDIDLVVTREDLEHFEDICRFTTKRLKISYVEYFKSKGIDIGEDISIAVKLIIPSTFITRLYGNIFGPDQIRNIEKDEKWIITAFRDPDTFENIYQSKREVGSRVYDIKKNTAFSNIVVNSMPYFSSNDLKNVDGYLNENPDWQKHYNSALVVPIGYHPPSNLSENRCFGLLAVDSLNEAGANLFSGSECRCILSHGADLLANFFLAIALFRYSEQEDVNDNDV